MIKKYFYAIRMRIWFIIQDERNEVPIKETMEKLYLHPLKQQLKHYEQRQINFKYGVNHDQIL